MASNRIFWGIITAAAAGAVIGLLFAPEEGNKMRKKIKKKTNSLASELIEALEKSKENAEKLKSKGEDYKDDLLESAQETKDKFIDEQ
jgi:gas vesicle protein